MLTVRDIHSMSVCSDSLTFRSGDGTGVCNADEFFGRNFRRSRWRRETLRSFAGHDASNLGGYLKNLAHPKDTTQLYVADSRQTHGGDTAALRAVRCAAELA